MRGIGIDSPALGKSATVATLTEDVAGILLTDQDFVVLKERKSLQQVPQDHWALGVGLYPPAVAA